MIHHPTPESPAILWWSGGITSAVACKLGLEDYGPDNCRVVFMDTLNEDEDTYRFQHDCERWYGKEIEAITALEGVPGATKYGNLPYKSIKEVWIKYRSLNVANGAICSSKLKRDLRLEFQRVEAYSCQVFGFDTDPKEINRARNMRKNYPKANSVFPLIAEVLSKRDCVRIVEAAGIEVPRAYKLGLNNNNCLKTGCVQGGIGYWQLMRTLDYEKFEEMAKVEHLLSDLKGVPVSMCKDQSEGGGLVFLLPHPNFPHVKHIGQMKGRKPKPIRECSGFCGLNDGPGMDNDTEGEIFRGDLGSSTPTLFDQAFSFTPAPGDFQQLKKKQS